jgi:hypothetical protein
LSGSTVGCVIGLPAFGLCGVSGIPSFAFLLRKSMS